MPRIVRILVYEGTEKWLERTMEVSYITKDRPFNLAVGSIKEVFREECTDEQITMLTALGGS